MDQRMEGYSHLRFVRFADFGRLPVWYFKAFSFESSVQLEEAVGSTGNRCDLSGLIPWKDRFDAWNFTGANRICDLFCSTGDLALLAVSHCLLFAMEIDGFVGRYLCDRDRSHGRDADFWRHDPQPIRGE